MTLCLKRFTIQIRQPQVFKKRHFINYSECQKMNITYYTAFIRHNTSHFCFASLSDDKIDDEIKSLSAKIPENEDLFIRKETIKTQSKSNKSLHDAVKIKIKNDENFLKINHVSNKEQLDIWFLIQNDSYTPTNEGSIFLHENNLLKLWIDGKLQCLIGTSYKEKSKDCGYKQSYSELLMVFNTYKNIWDFEKYFAGISVERSGDYSKFHYKQESRILKIFFYTFDTKGSGRILIPSDISMNEDWANTFRTPVYNQQFQVVKYV